MTEQKTKIEIVAYKQGSNWVINSNEQIQQLPYYVLTKSQVKKYLEIKYSEYIIKIVWGV